MVRRILVTLLCLGFLGCGEGMLVEDEGHEHPGGDGDLGLGEAHGELGTVEQAAGSTEKVTGYFLPYPEGKAYRVTQYPHAYRTQIWNSIDIGVTRGNPIVAMRDGTVSAAIDTFPDYAAGTSCTVSSCNDKTNFLIIQHSDGNETSYLHIAQGSATALGMKQGTRVCAGQTIAKIGHNGYTSGPHVHVSAQKGGSAGDRNTAWSAMWSKNTKIIIFNETGTQLAQGSTYTSKNKEGCGGTSADAGMPKADAGTPKTDAGTPPETDAGTPPETDAGTPPDSDAGTLPEADAGSTGGPGTPTDGNRPPDSDGADAPVYGCSATGPVTGAWALLSLLGLLRRRTAQRG